MNKEIIQMQRVAKAALTAREQLGKSVEYARRGVVDEAAAILSADPGQTISLFGIKDTAQIVRAIPERLGELPGFIFHTLDRMAPGGRAIDPNLVNPLTGRVMTGSSSGSCVNILLAINDLAVGTDGGGSVLAPALATGLYSIMAKGLGLKGISAKRSTDSIKFVPGLGIISHSYDLCLQAVSKLTEIEVLPTERPEMAVIKPMDNRLAQVFEQTAAALAPKAILKFYDHPRCSERPALIDYLRLLFAKAQLVLSFEGPVDLYGYGDSVLGELGMIGRGEQGNGGKSFLKVTNMVEATAIGIPAQEIGSGVLVMAPPGSGPGSAALAVGKWLTQALPRPKLFAEYFIQSWARSGAGYL